MNIQANVRLGRGRTFLYEDVPVKVNPMPHHIAGLSYTATGYGRKIPTDYMVNYLGRWRRVYCCVFSNSGTLYIVTPKVELDREHGYKLGIIVNIERG